MCSRISWWFGRSYFVRNFRSITSNLNDKERNFINVRYLRLVKNLEKKTKRSEFFYYFFSSLVTTGSIIVPSLISIQDRAFKFNPSDEEMDKHSNNIYWTVWSISLIVTFSNAFIKMLRIDQTYIYRNLRLNQLKSEGVMFVSGIGDYKNLNNDQRFEIFVINVEKIKNLQMNQEFTQNDQITRDTVTRSVSRRESITITSV